MSERIELPEVAPQDLFLSPYKTEQNREIARRCNNWPEVADAVVCLLSAIEHFVEKNGDYYVDMEPHIKELERLIGGEV